MVRRELGQYLHFLTFLCLRKSLNFLNFMGSSSTLGVMEIKAVPIFVEEFSFFVSNENY